jgi:hypothetical protein
MNIKIKEGCGDFNDGDLSYGGMVGKVVKRINSGWNDGCYVVKFENGDENVFFEEDVKVLG